MKDIGLTTAARFIVIACQLINIKLYSNYLNAGQLGLYYFLLTISYFGNALIFVPLDYYQQANLKKIINNSGGIHPLLVVNKRIVSKYLLFVFFIVAVCFFAAKEYLVGVVLAAMLAVLLYVVQAFRNLLNNLGYGHDMSISLMLEAVVKIAAFYILVIFFPADEVVLMLAWIFALVLAVVVLTYKVINHGLLTYTNEYSIDERVVFNFSYPISISAICNWVQLQGYRLLLVPLGFAELVGIFATISGIGSAGMSAVSTIFGQIYSPRIYSSEGRYTKVYLRNALFLIGIIAIFSLIFCELLVQLATKFVFVKYANLLVYGVLIEGGNLIIGALAIHITLTGHTKKIMNSAALGVFALIFVFALLFIFQLINIYTVGTPLVLSQLTVLIYMYWKFKNE